MAGATFPRIKNWVDAEVLTNEDLNAEIDQIRNNLTPAGADDHSVSTAQMRAETNPGSVGSESLATSTAGELERLRYALRRLIGGTYWYSNPALTLAEAQTLLTQVTNIPPNRILSGRSDSKMQPTFLVPDGTTNSVTLKGATTPFVLRINDAQVTFSTDVVLPGLTTAPTANNTATVNNAAFTGGVETRRAGEDIRTAGMFGDVGFPGTQWDTITMSAAGTEITSRVGQFAAFKVVNGVNTEYFIGFIKSTTEITRCFRGYFYDSTDLPFKRIALNNGNTITLMRLTWVFAKNDGLSLEVTYNNPTYLGVQPASPSPGDYWYDLSVAKWKYYTGTTFVDANVHLIGVCFQNGTATLGARSFEFYANYNATNTLTLSRQDATIISQATAAAQISVAGRYFDFRNAKWSLANNLAPGVILSPNTLYSLYVTNTGRLYIDNEFPYVRDNDLLGAYHPYAPWRCVGYGQTDGSNNWIAYGPFNDGVFPNDSLDGNVIQDNTLRITKLRQNAVFSVNIAISQNTNFGTGVWQAIAASAVLGNWVAGRPVYATLVPDTSSGVCQLYMNRAASGGGLWALRLDSTPSPSSGNGYQLGDTPMAAGSAYVTCPTFMQLPVVGGQYQFYLSMFYPYTGGTIVINGRLLVWQP